MEAWAAGFRTGVGVVWRGGVNEYIVCMYGGKRTLYRERREMDREIYLCLTCTSICGYIYLMVFIFQYRGARA